MNISDFMRTLARGDPEFKGHELQVESGPLYLENFQQILPRGGVTIN